MNATLLRRSPIADWPAAGRLVERSAAVWLQDFSWQQRFGCKGPGAAQWLAAQRLTVPAAANSWLQDRSDILIARIATSEFLVEAMGSGQQLVAALDSLSLTTGVYPVIRQDAAFLLGGPRARELLLETCSFPFDPAAPGNPVILTSMVGVGVMVIPRVIAAQPQYRIWCDPSFGLYLWSTLIDIAVELGGGALADPDGQSVISTGES